MSVEFNVKHAEVAALVTMYREAALRHGAATEQGDQRRANRHHDEIACIYRELRSRGDQARSALLPLLDDIEEHVRAWAGAHALEFAPERAVKMLQRLAQRPGLVGFNAAMILQEWQSGSLRFP